MRRPLMARWAQQRDGSSSSGSKKKKGAWLRGVFADTYGNQAKRAGLRSRAAAKLQQLDDKFRLLRPGMVVLDLGAAPGGWTQVAAARVATMGGGQVIAVDLTKMDPIPGATTIQADASSVAGMAQIRALLPRRGDGASGRCDILLSDMAPRTSGNRAKDHERSLELCSLALRGAREFLAEGGTVVAKVFQGGTENELLRWSKLHFATAKFAKPPASKAVSREIFLVATGHKGGRTGKTDAGEPPPPTEKRQRVRRKSKKFDDEDE
jgi:23S rRNA (uridine2552-2'-O)-methyltransferase